MVKEVHTAWGLRSGSGDVHVPELGVNPQTW